MITFYGYAVENDGKFLGYSPKRNAPGKMYKKRFYRRPMFPVVSAFENSQKEAHSHLGRVVKVKLTMEEVK